MNTYAWRDCATDAIRFWEPRRVIYNLVLATIVGIYFGISYPLSRTMLTLDFCLALFLLAVVAKCGVLCGVHCGHFRSNVGLSRTLATIPLGALRNRNHVCRDNHSLHCNGHV
jgi:hypothetical protein